MTGRPLNLEGFFSWVLWKIGESRYVKVEDFTARVCGFRGFSGHRLISGDWDEIMLVGVDAEVVAIESGGTGRKSCRPVRGLGGAQRVKRDPSTLGNFVENKILG